MKLVDITAAGTPHVPRVLGLRPGVVFRAIPDGTCGILTRPVGEADTDYPDRAIRVAVRHDLQLELHNAQISVIAQLSPDQARAIAMQLLLALRESTAG